MPTLGAMAEQLVTVDGKLADVTEDGKVAKLTDDGKLAKVILHEGKGSLPPLHARCLGAPQQPSQNRSAHTCAELPVRCEVS